MPRVIVLWCPDWPVVAAMEEAGVPDRMPAAVIEKGAVVACNDPARDEGVRRGQRRRDAQARCPELMLLDASSDRDAHAFESVLAAIEELRPGVAPLRPGLVAMHPPGRYFGGEAAAAAAVAERLVDLGVWDCRFGIADDLFTAEQAARRALRQDSLVVEPGGSSAFLRDLPVEVLATDPEGTDVVDLLRRLGIRTLGELAGLPARDIHARFGAYGARIHRLSSGDASDGADQLNTRVPPPELTCEIGFEPPLVAVEAVTFSVRRTLERFASQLAERHLVCTRVLIEAESESVVVSARSWAHPRWFELGDLTDRVRWQLSALGGRAAPVDRVRFVPETVEADAAYADGLWGGDASAHVERGVARVQALLGYDAVVTPVLQGGRGPADRQAHVPWGEQPRYGQGGLRPRGLPWPGSIPAPAPSRVLAEPWQAAVTDAHGRITHVTERGAVSGEPARFRAAPDQAWQPVACWAGPWPVDELWWEPLSSAHANRRVVRFQIVGADGRAWLLSNVGKEWFTEALYD